MSEVPRLGVFGSAFNPPHLAHLVLAGEAIWQLGLDQLFVVPTGNAYHKGNTTGPGPEGRLRLANAAFASVEAVDVSDIEVRRSGPSYTCETLELIAEQDGNSEIHLLMGADAACGFSEWKRPERILELARIAVAHRSGTERETVEEVFSGLGADDRLGWVKMPRIDISSSMVRGRAEAGQPLSHLVPEAVAEMIENEGMYAPN